MTYNGRKTTFDGEGSWSFGNDFQVLIIVYHLVLIIKKNNFLVLGKGPTQEINDSTGAAEKEISKVNTKFCLSLHYNGDEGYFYVNTTYEQINNLKSKYNIS